MFMVGKHHAVRAVSDQLASKNEHQKENKKKQSEAI